jgi:hypothetical protein
MYCIIITVASDVGKRAVSSGGKKVVCAYREQYPGAGQQNIANYLQLSQCGTELSISQCCVGDVLNERGGGGPEKEMEHPDLGSVKFLKDAKLEGLEDVLVIWIGQVNEKNRTATDR